MAKKIENGEGKENLKPNPEIQEQEGFNPQSTELTFVDKVRILRLAVDATMNTIKSPHCLQGSAELTKANNSLTMAKSWMGKILQLANEVNPYPTSHDATSPTIEKAAEHTNETRLSIFEETGITTQTGRVKDLRAVIGEVVTNFRSMVANEPLFVTERKFDTMLPVFVLQHMEEAKMWLGWELNRIRETIEYEEYVKVHGENSCQAPTIPLQ